MEEEVREELKDLKEEIGKQAEYEGLANTAGGKRLIKQLQNDIKGSVEGLCSQYKELPHIEMIAIIARLSERLELLKTLEGSSQKKKEAQERYTFLSKKTE